MSIYERQISGLEMWSKGPGWLQIQRLKLLARVAHCQSAIIVEEDEWHRDVTNYRIEFDASQWTGRP